MDSIFSGVKRALFLGSHPDDVETGAGGLLLRLIGSLGKENCFYMVFATTTEQPGNEEILDELKASLEVLGLPESNHSVAGIPNTRFPENEAAIRQALEKARDSFSPDLVVTHHNDNTHQDHKSLAEQAIRVFRTQTILMYDDLKSTPRFVPNLVVSLTPREMDGKVSLMECYRSQFRRHYHDTEYLKSIARMRGKRLGLDWGEAYHVYQMVLK